MKGRRILTFAFTTIISYSLSENDMGNSSKRSIIVKVDAYTL
jgi:hypothetical protein